MPRRLLGSAATSAFYGTQPVVCPQTTWFPGQVIQCGNTGHGNKTELNELKGWMHQLIADMQTTILECITDI